MEIKNVIRSHTRNETESVWITNPGGPFMCYEGYSSESGGFITQLLMKSVTPGVFLVVLYFDLNSNDTAANHSWKQRTRVRCIVTNSDNEEVSGNVWPTELVIEIEEHTHTFPATVKIAESETIGMDGWISDEEIADGYINSMASRRTQQSTQMFFVVRCPENTNVLFVRDPMGDNTWQAEVYRLSNHIAEGVVEI